MLIFILSTPNSGASTLAKFMHSVMSNTSKFDIKDVYKRIAFDNLGLTRERVIEITKNPDEPIKELHAENLNMLINTISKALHDNFGEDIHNDILISKLKASVSLNQIIEVKDIYSVEYIIRAMKRTDTFLTLVTRSSEPYPIQNKEDFDNIVRTYNIRVENLHNVYDLDMYVHQTNRLLRKWKILSPMEES